MAWLYESAKNTDGPVGQGMREMYAEYGRKMRLLLQRYEKEVRSGLADLLQEMKRLQIPHVIVP